MDTREDTRNATDDWLLGPREQTFGEPYGPPPDDPEEWREWLSKIPGVRIYRRDPNAPPPPPCVPWLSVTGPVNIRKVMGRDDYDEPDEAPDGNASSSVTT
jgi:hypothetical protein